MSSQEEMRPMSLSVMPRLPFEAVERILNYVSSTKDLKNCRLVCYNWLFVVDVFVGVGLKLTRANKAKLFASQLLRTCTSLKIHEDAGKLNWYVCYFSPTKLKSVQIQKNILTDNWRLLLESCQSIELLTITAHVLNFNKTWSENIIGTFNKKDFDFPAEFHEGHRINHPNLRRIVFNGISMGSFRQGVLGFYLQDFVSIANILKSIGVTPKLKQIIMIDGVKLMEYLEGDSNIKPALLSLMERNPTINGIGILSENSSFSNMDLWDGFLREDQSCLAQISGFYLQWHQIFSRLPTVNTLYFRVADTGPGNFQGLVPLLNLILQQSDSLRKLFLLVDSNIIKVFDCRRFLNAPGLARLTDLTLTTFRTNDNCKNVKLYRDVLNLNVFTGNNVRLEYLYLSIPVIEETMDAIFAIPLLKELHIVHQNEGNKQKFKKRHFDAAINHPHLKIIFWDKSLQEKWNRFNSKAQNKNWDCEMLKRKALKVIKPARGPGCSYVQPPDEGFGSGDPTNWNAKFTNQFVVFNTTRLDERDWARIENFNK